MIKDEVLPCDLQIGCGTIRKGVSMTTVQKKIDHLFDTADKAFQGEENKKLAIKYLEKIAKTCGREWAYYDRIKEIIALLRNEDE